MFFVWFSKLYTICSYSEPMHVSFLILEDYSIYMFYLVLICNSTIMFIFTCVLLIFLEIYMNYVYIFSCVCLVIHWILYLFCSIFLKKIRILNFIEIIISLDVFIWIDHLVYVFIIFLDVSYVFNFYSKIRVNIYVFFKCFTWILFHF